MKRTLSKSTILSLLLCQTLVRAVAAEGDDGLAAGLVATFRDDARTVSRVVSLPELGLAADESPHPAIKPDFKAVYEGLLVVVQPGTYRFESAGSLSLNGKPADGEVKLDAGRHALRIDFARPQGAVSTGLAWESEHFIKEPVPPSALRHDAKAAPKPAQDSAGEHPSPPLRIERAITEMKCASCHEPDFLATMHHKFAPDSLLTHMRHANPMKWYGAMTGPVFEDSELMSGLANDLNKLPGGERERSDSPAEVAKGLAMTGTQKGLACIACHDIRHYRTAAESKGPNLAYVTNRVSYDWFVRWMTNPQRHKPGVPMPAFFAGQKPEESQGNIDALWDYLSLEEAMPLPEELKVSPNQFILEVGAAPLVNRAYMKLSDGQELLRAICVGLPNGMSYCFDAETCRLAYVWSGGFLNMAPHWQNQSGFPTPPVGNAFYLPSKEEGLRGGDKTPVFHGYEMVDGIPRFSFTIGETEIQVRIDSPSPGQLRQTYEIAEAAGPLEYIGPSGDAAVSVKASRGKWTGNRLAVSGEGKLELIMEKKQ